MLDGDKNHDKKKMILKSIKNRKVKLTVKLLKHFFRKTNLLHFIQNKSKNIIEYMLKKMIVMSQLLLYK